jgi:hypothetical protein
MFFVAQPVCALLPPSAAALPGDWRHSAPAGSAAVARDATATVPGDWPAPTSATRFQ